MTESGSNAEQISWSHSACSGSFWTSSHHLPPPTPNCEICRSFWSSSSAIFRGLGACLCSFPCSLLQRSHKNGYAVYSSEIFSEQLGGIHLEHSVREGTRAQRVQTRHTLLSASVTWHDILIRRGQSWEICVKTQIWTFPDYYGSKKLNWVLFFSPVSHFHIGNTFLFTLLPIFTL